MSTFEGGSEKIFLVFLTLKNFYFLNIRNTKNTYENHCQTYFISYSIKYI